MTKRQVGILMMLLGFTAVLCAGALMWNSQRREEKAAQENASVLSSLKKLIQENPEQGIDSDLPVLPIEGYDCIGYLEVEGTDLAWPVESSAGTGEWIPCVVSGNPANEKFIIRGAYKKNVFASLSEIQEGDIMRFVQINGAEKEYLVHSSGLIQRETDITEDALLLECHHLFGMRYLVNAGFC